MKCTAYKASHTFSRLPRPIFSDHPLRLLFSQHSQALPENTPLDFLPRSMVVVGFSPLFRRAEDGPEDSLYHYTPTEYICAIFVGLFGLSTRKSRYSIICHFAKQILVIHLGQAIRFRLWWLLPTVVLAGLTEVIGWSGRLWSSQNPTLLTPFLMQ